MMLFGYSSFMVMYTNKIISPDLPLSGIIRQYHNVATTRQNIEDLFPGVCHDRLREPCPAIGRLTAAAIC
jgi:hypothetical protein